MNKKIFPAVVVGAAIGTAIAATSYLVAKEFDKRHEDDYFEDVTNIEERSIVDSIFVNEDKEDVIPEEIISEEIVVTEEQNFEDFVDSDDEIYTDGIMIDESFVIEDFDLEEMNESNLNDLNEIQPQSFTEELSPESDNLDAYFDEDVFGLSDEKDEIFNSEVTEIVDENHTKYEELEKMYQELVEKIDVDL